MKKIILTSTLALSFVMHQSSLKAKPVSITCPPLYQDRIDETVDELTWTGFSNTFKNTGGIESQFKEAQLTKPRNIVCEYAEGSIITQLPWHISFSSCKFTNPTTNHPNACVGDTAEACTLTCEERPSGEKPMQK